MPLTPVKQLRGASARSRREYRRHHQRGRGNGLREVQRFKLHHRGAIGAGQNFGHLLFLAAGLVWACYTVAMRRARLDGLHAAAIAGVGSLVLYLPIYAAIAGDSLLNAPLFDIALQAIVQGLLTAIVALLLYGRMVSILGATGGAAFVALTPAMTALLAIPVLDEWPSPIDWVAIALISMGVYVVSGGPLQGRRT